MSTTPSIYLIQQIGEVHEEHSHEYDTGFKMKWCQYSSPGFRKVAKIPLWCRQTKMPVKPSRQAKQTCKEHQMLGAPQPRI